jgi:hypothetical protein
MKSYYKKKFSKVTFKSHHKHKLPAKEKAKEVTSSGLSARPEDIHLHKPQ